MHGMNGDCRSVAVSGAARRAVGGFSLMEMMLVVVIIGILATVVVVNIGGQSIEARKGVTRARMGQIEQAVTNYLSRHGAYPQQLVMLTGEGGYLKKVPQDAWKTEFYYNVPGQQVGRPYDLLSLGPDKLPGTADDMDVWTLDENQ